MTSVKLLTEYQIRKKFITKPRHEATMLILKGFRLAKAV